MPGEPRTDNLSRVGYPAPMVTRPPVPLLCAVLLAACGGNCPEASTAPAAAPAAQPAAPGPAPEPAAEPAPAPELGAEQAPEPSVKAHPDVAFPENASVADAERAVPQGVERANIDPESLGAPLQDPELLSPCNPGSQKVRVKVAVWNGKAVGVDVTSPNKKLAECVAARVREVEWNQKVRSLNTIELQF